MYCLRHFITYRVIRRHILGNEAKTVCVFKQHSNVLNSEIFGNINQAFFCINLVTCYEKTRNLMTCCFWDVNFVCSYNCATLHRMYEKSGCVRSYIILDYGLIVRVRCI